MPVLQQPFIVDIYKVFSKYKLGEKVTGHYCNVCLSKEYSHFLTSTPLSELGPENFEGYLTSVDILDDNCNDFRYFLPRILELLYTSADQTFYFFDCAWKVIGQTNHQAWPLEEQQALTHFAKAYLTKARASGEHIKLEIATDELNEANLFLT